MEGKVRSLYARPIQSSDLAFEVPGIISLQGTKAQLGERVVAYSIEEKIYPLLDTKEKDENEQDSLFKYKAEAILKQLDEALLYTVISGSLRSSLKQAILLRANAYLEKYNSISEIQEFYDKVYKKKAADEEIILRRNDKGQLVDDKNQPVPVDSEGRPNDPSKPPAVLFKSDRDKISRLESLSTVSSAKHESLIAKYGAANKTDVITQNASTTESGANDSSETTVKILPTASKTLTYNVTVSAATHATDAVRTISGKTDGTDFQPFNAADKPSINAETSNTRHSTNQRTTTDLVELKHPSKDASIDYERIQLDLQDELLKHQIISKKVQNMTSIMNNELRLLELDINKLQHAFLQTVLVSPISGIVTAIYKDKGETVSPGEPVIRVENDDELLIVGFIQYRGLLQVGQTVKLKTTMFEATEKEIPGKIVSIRGHDADDDEWDVIIRYQNKDKDIPINYHFDKDNTTISIDS